MNDKLPNNPEARHDADEQPRKRAWTPEEIEGARVARVQKFEEELRSAMARDRKLAKAIREGKEARNPFEKQESVELLESDQGQWYLAQPEARADIRASWIDYVRRDWRAQLDGRRQYEAELRASLQSPPTEAEKARVEAMTLDALKESFIGTNRRSWLAMCDESSGECFAGYSHRDDALAERFVTREGVPLELFQAREVVRAAVHAARLLEQNFLEGPLPTSVDPKDDVKGWRLFVERTYTSLTTQGPGLPDMIRWSASADMVKKYYGTAPAAEQRRWRVALMRWLDECVDRSIPDLDGDSLTSELKNLLPFPMVFERKALTKLLAAWRVKRAGAKRTDSGLAGGKWEILRELLQVTWGHESASKTLQDEYKTYARGHADDA